MKTYITVILIFTMPYNVNALSNTYELLCNNECKDVFSEIDNMVSVINSGLLPNDVLTQYEPFSPDDLFITFDSNVPVNSATYRGYLSQTKRSPSHLNHKKLTRLKPLGTSNFSIPSPQPQDGALSCEHDTDYDCEAWGDYSGEYKSHILAIQNQVYNYQWGYTLTQSDIERVDLAHWLRYHFAVGVISFSPASRLTTYLQSKLKFITNESMASLLIAAGISNVVVNGVFNGPAKSNLKAGDVIMFKKGKLVSIARDGIIYDATTIMGPIANPGKSSGGGAGEGHVDAKAGGYAEGSILRGGGVVRIPRISFCYRTFSNGQVIQVPCP